jgi:hypothetical protein
MLGISALRFQLPFKASHAGVYALEPLVPLTAERQSHGEACFDAAEGDANL